MRQKIKLVLFRLTISKNQQKYDIYLQINNFSRPCTLFFIFYVVNYIQIQKKYKVKTTAFIMHIHLVYNLGLVTGIIGLKISYVSCSIKHSNRVTLTVHAQQNSSSIEDEK